mgnify:CR=1 FL=1
MSKEAGDTCRRNEKGGEALKMKKGITAAAVVLLCGLMFGAGFFFGNKEKAQGVADEKDRKECLQSVVLLEAFDEQEKRLFQGTGFCAFRSDCLFTAYHAVQGMKYAVITTESGKQYTLDCVLQADDIADVAILQLPDASELRPLALAEELPERGEDVTVIGCPRGFRNLVSKGNCSGIWEMTDFNRLIITAAVDEGSSGSPVFDSEGNVAGLVTTKYKNSEALSFATDSVFLINMANKCGGEKQ